LKRSQQSGSADKVGAVPFMGESIKLIIDILIDSIHSDSFVKYLISGKRLGS
jgi:hypothetical protein